MHIGETKVTSPVTISQLLMIKTEGVQHCRVQVMHTGSILFCTKTEFVCGTMNSTTFDSPACHPDGESIVIVVAPQF